MNKPTETVEKTVPSLPPDSYHLLAQQFLSAGISTLLAFAIWSPFESKVLVIQHISHTTNKISYLSVYLQNWRSNGKQLQRASLHNASTFTLFEVLRSKCNEINHPGDTTSVVVCNLLSGGISRACVFVLMYPLERPRVMQAHTARMASSGQRGSSMFAGVHLGALQSFLYGGLHLGGYYSLQRGMERYMRQQEQE